VTAAGTPSWEAITVGTALVATMTAYALFACSSLLAPFFLGTAVGAVTTGRIPVPSPGISTAAWTTPTALVTGGLFVAACAFIGAVYLVGDASRRGHDDLVTYFGHRAVISGAVTGVLAAASLALLHSSAPYVFGRLTGVALPLVIISVLAGTAAVTLIVLRRQWLLRIAGGLSVAAVLAAWSLAQYPWLFPTSLSIAAAPSISLTAEIAVIGMAWSDQPVQPERGREALDQRGEDCPVGPVQQGS
jgi:cytochrome bd ubiquinol oxidase subunit II